MRFRNGRVDQFTDLLNDLLQYVNFIVYSALSCASQPISLHIFFFILANLITYFVNICSIYEVNH